MKRKLLYITLIITILCVISIIICNRRIKKNASQKLYTEITETPKNNVGLLLGTSPKLKKGITIYILTTVFLQLLNYTKPER